MLAPISRLCVVLFMRPLAIQMSFFSVVIIIIESRQRIIPTTIVTTTILYACLFIFSSHSSIIHPPTPLYPFVHPFIQSTCFMLQSINHNNQLLLLIFQVVLFWICLVSPDSCHSFHARFLIVFGLKSHSSQLQFSRSCHLDYSWMGGSFRWTHINPLRSHPYLPTCLPTYLPTYTHARMHASIRPSMHTCMHTYVRPSIHSSLACMHDAHACHACILVYVPPEVHFGSVFRLLFIYPMMIRAVIHRRIVVFIAVIHSCVLFISDFTNNTAVIRPISQFLWSSLQVLKVL